jgi:DNA-binding NarL/FixJ family response regulator
VLVVTANGDPRTVRRSLRAGAKGFLLKTCDPSSLLSALHTVARGEEALSPDVMGILRDASENGVPGGLDPLDRLSSRELQVLQLIGEGRTGPEIARTLSIGRTTVESHRRRIMRKLGLRNHAELARFALRERLTM